MKTYQVGETVRLKVDIESAGVAYDPTTSVKITVTDPAGSAVVTEQTATKDSTGSYHYDYLAGATEGVYTAKWTATDNSILSRKKYEFNVEAW